MRIRIILIVCGALAVVAVGLVAVLPGGGGSRDSTRRAAAPVKVPVATRPVVQPVNPRVPTRAVSRLPVGSLRVPRPKLMAGQGAPTLRARLRVTRRSPGRLVARLPARFVQRSVTGLRFAGTPRLATNAGGRVRLANSGRRVTIDLTRARAGDGAVLAIPHLALPAGTYELPLTWRAANGSSKRLRPLRIAVLAGTREQAGEADASNDTDEESETFVAASPGNPNRVAVGSNNMVSGRRGIFLSSDGGTTWAAPLMPTTLDIAGTSTDEQASLGGDPILAADEDGNVWAGGLTRCRSGASSRVFVVRAAAGSSQFQTKGVGLRFNSSGTTCALQDKPMMTIDNWPGSPTYGRLYVTWDNPNGSAVDVVISSCDTRPGGNPDAAHCDNADNWSAPVVVSGSTPGSYITSDPAVGPDGKVYVVWWDYSATNAISIATCATGCDTQAGWPASSGVAVALDGTGGPIPFACPIVAQPGGRAAPVPSIALDSSSRIYLAWSDLRPGSGTARCDNTAGDVPRSTNQTWDSYVASAASLSDLLHDTPASRTSATQGSSIIGDTSTSSASAANSDDWFPWVAVNRADGQAWVDVMSTTGDATRATTHPYLRSVTPGATGTQVTYGALTPLSTTASDYSWNLPCCSFDNDYGDYTGLAVAGGFPYAVWTRRAGQNDDGDVLAWVPNPAPPAGTGTTTSTTPTTPTTPSGTPTTPSTSTTPTTPVTPTILPIKPGLGTSIPRQTRAVVLKRGLLVRTSCRARCRLTLRFVAKVKSGTRMVQRTLVTKTFTFSGKRSLRLKLGATARRVLRTTPTRRLTVLASATAVGGLKQTATRPVSLR